jgi:hypothetical protein
MSTDNTPSTPRNMQEVLNLLMEESLRKSMESRSRKNHGTPLADALTADLRAAFPAEKVVVRFCYSGAADSGWFDDIDVYFTTTEAKRWPNATELDKVNAIIAKHDKGKIYEELYPILETRAPGWEINDGSSGGFVFNPDGTRVHQHDENIVEVNSSEWEF